MKPEDIDDLFRQQLGDHATPPPPDLWARLSLPTKPAPEPDADPLDTLFRAGLATHATPPRRELWERLEDEHLRPLPRRRRVAAWWQYSAAAVLLLLVLAGGALWHGGAAGPANGGLATTKATHNPAQPGQPAAPGSTVPSELTSKAAETTTPIAAQLSKAVATTANAASKENQQIFSIQATAPQASTSSTPMAATTPARRAAAAAQLGSSHRLQQGQQPDATANPLATTGRRTPAGQLRLASAVVPAPTEVVTTPPAPQALATATPASTPEIIEVEVRRGAVPNQATTPVVVAMVEATPTPVRRPRLHLGGLLRQADHLVHGEHLSLAEATGLPETVTVQAHLGGRYVSKTIQL
jgi:hypothetical protein